MRTMRLAVTAAAALAATHAHAAPILGVGDCVGPKITSVRQVPGTRVDFYGVAAPVFASPGGPPTGRRIPPGETYLVTEVQGGFLHLKASVN